MNKDEFAAWLKRYNLSVIAAGKLLGYTRGQIYNYAEGRTPIPARTVLAIQQVTVTLELAQRPGIRRALDEAKGIS